MDMYLNIQHIILHEIHFIIEFCTILYKFYCNVSPSSAALLNLFFLLSIFSWLFLFLWKSVSQTVIKVITFFAKLKLSTKNIFVKIAAKFWPGVRLFPFFHFPKIWNDNFFKKKIKSDTDDITLIPPPPLGPLGHLNKWEGGN